MRINHNEAQEQKENRLYPVGDYFFEVLAAFEGKSTKGNEMFTVKLAVFNADGKKKPVKDYMGSWDWQKLQVFSEATGLLDKYTSGELEADDLIGASGTVHIKHGKDMKGDPQMQVGWYVPAREGQAPARPVVAPAPEASQDDNDLPF